MLIQGQGLTKAKADLQILGQKYSDYEIVVSDHKPVSVSPEGLPNYTKPLCDQHMPYYLHKNAAALATSNNEHKHVSTIGVFAMDDLSIGDSRMFAISAAHGVMTEDEQKNIMVTSRNIETARFKTRHACEAMIGRIRLNKETITIALHNGEHIHVKRNYDLLISFCQYIPSVANGQDQLKWFQKFASDIALLPVDPKDFGTDVFTETAEHSLLHSYSEPVALESIDGSPKRYPIKGFINIRNADDIAKLREEGVKVFVEERCGTLCPQPESFTNVTTHRSLAGPSLTNRPEHESHLDSVLAPHFAFTTDKA